MKSPAISKDLLEYLEKVFAPAHVQCAAATEPHMIAAMVHREMGIQQVIKHLRAEYENQQLEDPLNVHQGTEAP